MKSLSYIFFFPLALFFVNQASAQYTGGNGRGDVMEEVTEQSLLQTGLSDLSKSFESVKVYPNPATTELNIMPVSFGKNEVTLTVFDLQGRILQQRTVSEHTTLSVNDWPAGVYMIYLQSGSEYYRTWIVH
jgi:hypothetical protein